MPYIDIQNQDYVNTLYLYTIGLKNGRYDTIDTDGIKESYSNNASDLHSFDKLIQRFNENIQKIYSSDIASDSLKISEYYYNTYNTYRKFITYDSSLLKLNESTITQHVMNDNAYNLNMDSSTNIYNLYDFKGIALNYYYPLNGRIATLEDIFAEYFYDYIVAIDMQNEAENRGYYYFDKSLPYQLQFSYSILSIGSTFENEDGEKETILYDGTTIPTVDDIISERMYIVIQSGKMPPRKIYFTNEYGPTLFLNDDKYNLKYRGQSDKDLYEYILNDNQIFKLCDITRFRSWGYKLSFPDKDNKLNPFLSFNNILSINIGDKITDIIDKLYIRLYTFAILITYGGENTTVASFNIGNNLIDEGITKKNILDHSNIKFNASDFKIPEEAISGNNININSDILNTSFITSSINDTYTFIKDKKMGNVLQPKTTNENTYFAFCVIPAIVIKECSYNLISSSQDTSSDLNIKLTPIPTAQTITIPFKFYQCNLLTEGNVLDHSNDNSQFNNTKFNGIKMYIDDIRNKAAVKIAVSDNITVSNTETVDDPISSVPFNNILQGVQFSGKLEFPDGTNENNAYGLLLSKIPFKDLTTYQMYNIIQVQTPNIKIEMVDVIPGFYTKENEEYLPAFMEYIQPRPVFLKYIE